MNLPDRVQAEERRIKKSELREICIKMHGLRIHRHILVFLLHSSILQSINRSRCPKLSVLLNFSLHLAQNGVRININWAVARFLVMEKKICYR